MPESKSRLPAVCTTCGAAYAARQHADGSINLIGKQNECECGSTEFVAVDKQMGVLGDDPE